MHIDRNKVKLWLWFYFMNSCFSLFVLSGGIQLQDVGLVAFGGIGFGMSVTTVGLHLVLLRLMDRNPNTLVFRIS